MQTNSLKDLLQNKIDDMEKQVLSRVNTLEETKGASRNDSEQRNKVETTLTSLHHRITDLEKGVFAPTSFCVLFAVNLPSGISGRCRNYTALRADRTRRRAELHRCAYLNSTSGVSLHQRTEITQRSCTQTSQGASGTAPFVRASTIARACPLGG